MVKAMAQQADKNSDAPIHQAFDMAKQRQFGEMVVAKLGFDFSRGRQDESVHPFCSNFSRNDVRLTTRFDPNWLSPALFGTIHEAGHGMYEQGSPEHLDHTILAGGTSLGIHESQSRMWENIVGRGRPFWQHFYGQLQATFPEALGQVSLDDFYRAINQSKPSLIRVEADEATYNLHIMVRFDLEVAVLNGQLAIKDLPEAWNAKYEEYLGIRPPNNRLGVLQDIHWSMGIMGYFPTYALGNLLSVQFYNLVLQDHPSLPDEMAAGKFDTLLEWMRKHIHQHGRKYSSRELVKRVTGGEMQTAPFLGYIRQKFGQLYDL
jgi:carboxypeptidase Taq